MTPKESGCLCFQIFTLSLHFPTGGGRFPWRAGEAVRWLREDCNSSGTPVQTWHDHLEDDGRSHHCSKPHLWFCHLRISNSQPAAGKFVLFQCFFACAIDNTSIAQQQLVCCYFIQFNLFSWQILEVFVADEPPLPEYIERPVSDT